MFLSELGLETPRSERSVKQVLEFETPEPPSYVTVRKKKKPVKSCDFIGDTLHTTVIESGNFPISDCQVKCLKLIILLLTPDLFGQQNLVLYNKRNKKVGLQLHTR